MPTNNRQYVSSDVNKAFQGERMSFLCVSWVGRSGGEINVTS
jgi:hypothetical protein